MSTPIPPTERERCPTCDRPTATPADPEPPSGVGALASGLCWRGCFAFKHVVDVCYPPWPPADWRARALAAEAQLAAYRAHERTEGRAGDGEGERG